MRSGIAILIIAVFLSAILVVALRHQGRQLSTELQVLRNDRDALNVEWGKLLLEEGAWSQHGRIEMVARKRLHMATPEPRKIVLIDLRQRKAP
ncbi:MAG: cell division protein FtsL [Acidiferrobacterales bacterium]